MGMLKRIGQAGQEMKDFFGKERPAPMLDPSLSGGGMIGLSLFLLFIFGIGVAVLLLGADPAALTAVFYFLCFLFAMLLLATLSTVKGRNRSLAVLTRGIRSRATITEKGESEDPDDATTWYWYQCEFNAHGNGDPSVKVKGIMSRQVEDEFDVGGTLAVRFDPDNPREWCMEPSPEEWDRYRAKRGEKVLLATSLICMGLVVWGLNRMLGDGVPLETADSQLGAYLDELLSHPFEQRRLELFLPIASIVSLAMSLWLLFKPLQATED